MNSSSSLKRAATLAGCILAVLAGAPVASAAPSQPGATTLPASDVTATSATLNGTVYPGQQPTTYYFEYGTTSAYGTQAPQPPASAPCNGNAGCSVSLAVSGLEPNMTYHYRLVATNNSGTVQGADVTFTTCASGTCGPAPPAVTTGPATLVFATSATLNGTINPEGQATTWQFQYGTTTAYGSVTPDPAGALPADTSDHGVSTPLTGLAPNTTYHYRLVGTNPSGTVLGADQTFITPAAPIPPTIGASPNPVVFGKADTISGQVLGPSPSGITVTLLENPFPFAAFTAVATTVSDPAGMYSFSRSPLLNTRYEVSAATTSGEAISPLVLVKVRPRVSLKFSPARPVRGAAAAMSGRVSPAHDGKVVRLQRRLRRTGRFRTIAKKKLGHVDATSSSYRFRLAHPRAAYYRVAFPADGDHASGKSPVRRLRFKSG